MSVEVINLTRTYGSQRAVDNISFLASKGDILGFLGPNGAGKSTTMKMATCYIPPTSGTIKVDGFDVVENPEAVKKIVGYLPEHNPLYPDMYVREYLSFIGAIHHLKGKFLISRIDEMVRICGLTLEERKKIGALSKGYRQRVGLAQALIHDPKVLILDEPTTGLDPNQILEIRELIRNIGKEKTVLFSTHIMQEVQALCNKVVIINKGKIVANSNVEELKNLHDRGKTILLEFENEVDLSPLKNDPEVEVFEALGGGKYRIKTNAHIDKRNEIFRMASTYGWPLTGLKQEESTLENIFKELTQSPK